MAKLDKAIIAGFVKAVTEGVVEAPAGASRTAVLSAGQSSTIVSATATASHKENSKMDILLGTSALHAMSRTFLPDDWAHLG
jgi:hypothetical protein